MSSTIKSLISVSLGLVLIYMILCVIVYFRQTGLIHIPSTQLFSTPSDIGLDYEDIWVNTENSKLHGWFIPHPESQFTVLLFHGNAGNISTEMETYKTLQKLKLSVLSYDYREYGLSKGKLSEAGMYEDAQAMWDYMVNSRNIQPTKIILFGRSLGTAVATWVAAENQSAGLIFESGFSSMADMARFHYKLVPTDLLLIWQYDSLSRIDRINAPALFLHSEEDTLTPIELSRMVYEAAPQEKTFQLIEGGHSYGFQQSHETYFAGLENFVNSL